MASTRASSRQAVQEAEHTEHSGSQCMRLCQACSTGHGHMQPGCAHLRRITHTAACLAQHTPQPGPHPAFLSCNCATDPFWLYGRTDCCLSTGTSLFVYISATTNFTGPKSTLCMGNLNMAKLGDVMVVLCPVTNYTTGYVTVMRNTTFGTLALQEIEPLYDGAARHT